MKAQRQFSEHCLAILGRGCLDRVQSRVKRVVAKSVTCFLIVPAFSGKIEIKWSLPHVNNLIT
jgi:hypothetical protein